MADASLDPAPVWDCLGTFDGRPWRGAVDCVCAGLPCQPYSVAGRRRGHADERAIWPEFIRLLEEIEPGAVFLENVPRFVTAGYFRDIGERLLGLGYRIPPSLEVSAKDVGASHLRKRAFILAYRDDADGWRQIQAVARRARERRGKLGSIGCGLVHPDSARRPPSGRGRAFDAGRKFESGYSTVANPASRRLPQRDLSAGRREERPGALGVVRPGPPISEFHPPLFAPGRESASWPGILARRPDVEPSIRRVADGLAHRVDRLRVCGNGVVPLAAAVAFGLLLDPEFHRKRESP
ncbi:MAG: DNA cytosine methyltransferase [Planctomycetota bacterium]